MARYAVTLLSFCWLLGCERPDDTAPPGASVEGNQDWLLEEGPILSVGDRLESDDDLFRVVGAVRLDDGRIVVADGGQRLVVFDSVGTYLKTLGGRGAGPGEFQGIAWMHLLRPDTLLVFDRRLYRVSYFTVDSGLIDEISFRGVPPPKVVGRFADGTLLSIQESPPGEAAVGGPLARFENVLMRHGIDGRLVEILATVPGDEVLEGRPRYSGALLRRTRVVVGPREAYVATGDRFEVLVFGLEGPPSVLIQRAVEPTLVEQSDLDIWLPAFLRSAAGLAELPENQTLPVISDLLLDDTYSLWVGEFQRDPDTRGRWSVFDREGQYQTVLEMPERFRPLHIGRDFVLGVWRDSLDVEVVRLHRLTRGPS